METINEPRLSNYKAETKSPLGGNSPRVVKNGRKCVRSEFAEEPIDLTCSPTKIDLDEIEKAVQNNREPIEFLDVNQPSTSNSYLLIDPTIEHGLKGRSRKRKLHSGSYVPRKPQEDTIESFHLYTTDYLQIADRKQAEVLRAAKSLFSKRTRTLYRWMYPNISKAQLKTAVATSWDTLGLQEKDFYISQILGKFGSPQTNLMVNPLLDGIRTQRACEDTPTAAILHEDDTVGLLDWIHSVTNRSNMLLQEEQQRRGRLGRPPGSKNRKHYHRGHDAQMAPLSRDDAPATEFHDDPELSQELQQFSWTLQMNENGKN